jgi:hypothetical protein
MSILKTLVWLGTRPQMISDESEIVSQRFVITTAEWSIGGNQGSSTLALGDFIYLGYLPQDHVPVDWDMDSDGLDTNTLVTVSLGLFAAGGADLSTASAEGGAVWVANSTLLRAGGYVRNIAIPVKRVIPDSVNARTLALKVTAAATAFVAGVLAVTLWSRAAYQKQ